MAMKQQFPKYTLLLLIVLVSFYTSAAKKIDKNTSEMGRCKVGAGPLLVGIEVLDNEKSSELLKKEAERLQKGGTTCAQDIVTLSTLNRLRISQQHEKALACHVKYLDKNPSDSWGWSSLGQLYDQQRASKSSSTCFKSASKHGGKLSEFIRQWHFLGPFVMGKIEFDGDPAETYGGIRKASLKRYNKQERYYSELMADGRLGWLIYKQHSAGESIKVAPQINWNDLINSVGSTGILEWQGWMVGEFAVNEEGQNVIIQCLGVHTVYVDDIPITGDVYHRSAYWYSVPLDRGIHTIYIRLRAKARAEFTCSLSTVHTTFKVLKPHYIPDLYGGYLFGSYIGLPISNYNTKKWLDIRKISVTSPSHGQSGLSVVPEKEKFSIAPGQTRTVKVQLSADTDTEQNTKVLESCAELNIELYVSTSEGDQTLPLKLRCRKPHESFLFTFVDHDGSIQQAAAIEPLETCTQNLCPVVLTLHGTTVPPQSQADSYKHMVNDEYVFGFPHAWTLAPTRHGAHNWEGPGALTALQALESLARLTHAADHVQNKASSKHVIYAGHSMGGHGAWQLATHMPDRALAVISLAGWIKKEQYGDSNLFFEHDISTSSVDPAVKAVLEACITENESDRLASNLKGISVLVRIGAADRTIHPFFTRRMHRVLRHLGVNVTYSELPGKEHWWWDTWQTNDGGAVHDPKLRTFTNYHSIIPGETSPASTCTKETPCNTPTSTTSTTGASKYQRTNVQEFTYITTNPAFGETMHGLRVLQQTTPFRTTSIKVLVTASEVQLSTTNALRFTVSEPPIRPIGWFEKDIKVDGQTLLNARVWKDAIICFCREKLNWKVCMDCDSLESPAHRGPANLGPARRVAERPFLIVTGTQGAKVVTAMLLQSAVYIANLFFLTSDADAPIINDRALTQEVVDKYNLIILGSPAENSWSGKFLDAIPLSFDQNQFTLGSCTYRDQPTGGLFLAPHGRYLSLVLIGNSIDGFQDILSLATPTIPPMTRSPFSNLIPDYIITGPNYRSQGPGGFLCAGFWGNDWGFQPHLSSCSYCVDQ